MSGRRALRVPPDVAEVRIHAQVNDRLRDAAARLESEACGGLYGSIDGRLVTVAHTYECRNWSQTPAREFALDVDELFEHARMQPEDVRLLGIYHSHVGAPPVLSPLDRHYLGLFPWLWLLAGTSGTSEALELSFYVSFNGTVQSLPYVLVE